MYAPIACLDYAQTDIHALHFLAEHDNAAWLPVVARVTVLEGVGALEYEASICVPLGPDACNGNRIVEELHAIAMAFPALRRSK